MCDRSSVPYTGRSSIAQGHEPRAFFVMHATIFALLRIYTCRANPDLLRMASSTLTLTPDDALSVLEYWHASAERLVLVYRRAGECVTRIGPGLVRNATACELQIETGYRRLRITMRSAVFEFGALAPGSSACLRRTRSDGLLIRLDPGDWIFLRSVESASLTGRRSSSQCRAPGWARLTYPLVELR
jgi:hypothetical protein